LPYSFRDREGEFKFNSERSTEEMVHFAKRLARPPVQEVTDSKDIEMLKQTNKNFFMFIGKSVGHTWVLDNFIIQIKYKLFKHRILFSQDLFYDLAKQYQAHSYFYITPEITGKQVFIN